MLINNLILVKQTRGFINWNKLFWKDSCINSKLFQKYNENCPVIKLNTILIDKAWIEKKGK